jgi:hypothetical protein
MTKDCSISTAIELRAEGESSSLVRRQTRFQSRQQTIHHPLLRPEIASAECLLIAAQSDHIRPSIKAETSSSLEIHRYPALAEYDGYLSQLLPSLVN